MTLPLMPAAAGSRSGWRLAGAALLMLLAAYRLAGSAAWAQQSDPLSVTVKVDATAENVMKARETARIDGQRRALTMLAERFAGGGTAVKLPKLDDKTITDLVASFEVANERMSAVRYVADYTFHFRPAETGRVLAQAGVAAPGEAAAPPAPAAAASGKPMILIPVYDAGGQVRLWDDPNPWRDSWEHRPAGAGAGRLVVPLGDAGDLAAIDADKARSGSPEALAAVARRNGGDDTVVALAALRGPSDRPGGLDVTLRRYRGGRLTDSRSETLKANPGESADDLLRRAVAAIVGDIDSGWKAETAANADQEGSLTAVLPITGLEDWLRARDRLGALPAIRKLALVALSRQEATIEIGYTGSIDELKAALARISLDLVRGEPLWRLARTGPGQTP